MKLRKLICRVFGHTRTYDVNGWCAVCHRTRDVTSPYLTIDTDEARAHHLELANRTRARREAAERRLRTGVL